MDSPQLVSITTQSNNCRAADERKPLVLCTRLSAGGMGTVMGTLVFGTGTAIADDGGSVEGDRF